MFNVKDDVVSAAGLSCKILFFSAVGEPYSLGSRDVVTNLLSALVAQQVAPSYNARDTCQLREAYSLGSQNRSHKTALDELNIRNPCPKPGKFNPKIAFSMQKTAFKLVSQQVNNRSKPPSIRMF